LTSIASGSIKILAASKRIVTNGVCSIRVKE
jgi:hypothetical protein